MNKLLTIFICLTLSASRAESPNHTRSGAESNSLCDKALLSCSKVVDDYKELQAKDQEIIEVLKKQRDDAINVQGSGLWEKLELGAVGATFGVLLYVLIHGRN